MEMFTQNSTITIAVILFLVCIIIGFFADKYFKRKKELENIYNEEENNSTNNNANNMVDNQSLNEINNYQEKALVNNQNPINNVNLTNQNISNSSNLANSTVPNNSSYNYEMANDIGNKNLSMMDFNSQNNASDNIYDKK